MMLVAYSAPLAALSSDAPSGWLTVTVMEIFRPELKLNMIETYDVYSELHCCTGWQTLRSPMWEGRSARRAVQLQLEQREAGRACLTGLTGADGRWPSFSRSRDTGASTLVTYRALDSPPHWLGIHRRRRRRHLCLRLHPLFIPAWLSSLSLSLSIPTVCP